VLPLTLDFIADPAQLTVTVVQGEVLVETAQHRREMTLLFASLPMPMHLQPLADASEKLPAAFGAGDADGGVRLNRFTCVTARASLCLRLAHVVTSMRPRLDSRWGGSFPLRRREFHPLEASGLP
jgi:hypothetical protein